MVEKLLGGLPCSHGYSERLSDSTEISSCEVAELVARAGDQIASPEGFVGKSLENDA